MPHRPLRLCLLLLPAASCLPAADLATERLLDIAEEEAAIYKQLAEDPGQIPERDLERRIDELITAYRGYLLEHPEDVDALVLYGKLLRRAGDRKGAFESFLKADELDRELSVVKQQIGTYLAEVGKGKAALPFYLQAVELEPETAVYHFGLGQLLYRFRTAFIEAGIFTRDALDREMLKAFRRAARLEPGNFDFQMRLGEAYYDLDSPDWKAALLHWRELLDENASDELRRAILSLHLARVMGKLGRIEEARAMAQTVEQPALQHSKEQVLEALSRF